MSICLYVFLFNYTEISYSSIQISFKSINVIAILKNSWPIKNVAGILKGKPLGPWRLDLLLVL